MNKELKHKTITGVIWSAINQFGEISIKLIFGIFMARLLFPSDFGLVGMVTVFTHVANELMQGGFTKAYIQKRDTTHVHSASIFYFNIVFSIIIYIAFWVTAPLIADFYNEPQLIKITRVLSSMVIIDAFCAIKLAILIKEIDFRQKTILVIASNLIAGIIAVILATKDFGVWSLVVYTILQKTLLAIGLWWRSDIISIKYFSFTALKEMFSFGSWMLLGTLFIKFFENTNSLFIGKLFNATELGYFAKAREYQHSSSKQVTKAFTSVAFPVFSKLNGDKDRLRNGIRNFLQHVELAVLPVVSTLFVISTPFVMQILTPKWEPTIIYIKLLCIIGAFFPVNAVNVQYILSQGKSRHNFFLILIKNAFRLLNIAITYRYGVLYIVIGEVIISFFNLIFNTIYANKSIGYGLFKQMYDLRHHLTGALISVICGYFSIGVSNIYTIQLVMGIIITNGVFLLYQYTFNSGILKYVFRNQ